MSKIVETVRTKYGAVAASDLSSDHAGVHAVAEAFGYSAAELASIPADANMGLSCGNPTATASLRPGEVVLDLGCGGGLDVFLAAQKVGPSGKAIGLDMTPEMIDRAKRNAASAAGGKPIGNVEFLLGSIDQMPIPGGSVDCIISNCVINLATDKPAVFREMFRVLKSGGRVAVSDIALKKTLPPEIGNDLMAYVGCIAGAIRIEEYQRWLADAGFAHVTVIDAGTDLNAYSKVEGQAGCCSPPTVESSTVKSGSLPIASSSSLPIASSGGCCGGGSADASVHGGLKELLLKYDVNEFAASVKVYAIKPDGAAAAG